MAGYTTKQRADKGFDFFDPNGNKININQYVAATNANRQNLVKGMASQGDRASLGALQTQRSSQPGFNIGSFLNQTGRNLGNFGKTVNQNLITPSINMVKDDAQKVGATGAALTNGLGGGLAIAQDKVFNGGKNQQALIAATKDQMNKELARSFIPQNVANGKASPVEFGKSFASTGIKLAPYALGNPGGKLVDSVAGKVATKASTLFSNPAVRTAAYKTADLGTKALGDFGTNATTFGGLNVADQLVNTGKVDPMQALQTGLTAGAFGAGTRLAPVAAKGALRGSQAATKAGVKAVENVQQKGADAFVDKMAGQVGGRLGMSQDTFNNVAANGAKTTAKDVANYSKQLSKGKDIGPVSVTSGTDGALPITRDSANKLAAYRQIYQNTVGNYDNPLEHPLHQIPTQVVDQGFADGALGARSATAQMGSVGGGQTPLEEFVAGQAKPEFAPNSLTKGAKEGRQNISEDTAKLLDSSGHPVRNTAKLTEEGQAAVDSFKGSDALINEANKRLAVKPGNLDDNDISFLAKAIERLDNEGNFEAASTIHDSLSEHAVAGGQRVQALSILYNRSPEGLYNKALRDIKRGNDKNFTMTPEVQKTLQGFRDEIKKAATPEEKEMAIAKMGQFVQNQVPKGTAQNILSVWKAGLLSGPITHAGNALSNGTFGLLRKVSDAPATVADAGLAAFGKTKTGQKLGLTGERTKAFTLEGLGSGGQQGLKNAATTMKTGIDRRNIIDNKYEGHGELNFKNPVIQKVFGDTSNFVFRALGSGDQPFYFAAAKNSLFDQARAEAINKGLKGNAATNFVEQTVANPSKKMANRAQAEAWTAVLGEDRPIANSISQFVGKHPALQAIIPFTKVPTNFLAQTLDYTPVGPIAQIAKQAANLKRGEEIDQRLLSEAIGKGATGTGIIFLGSLLANSGQLSGQYPTDPKEVQRWKAEGIQPNSIKVGGQWVSLNYLGPLGILLQSGKDYHDAAAAGDNGAVQAIAGIGKSLTGQSFLTGFSGFANALNDPGRYGANLFNSQVGSVVPNIVAQGANLFDGAQRQANNAIETIQSRIPGLRNDLNQKQDVYGNPLGQRTNGTTATAPTDQLNLVTNPFRPGSDQSQKNSVVSEVDRLHNVDPNNSDLQVTPTTIDKSIKVNGVDVKLTDQQRYDLQNKVGQATQQAWGKLIGTPEYQKLNDTDKANALNKLRTDAAAVTQRAYVESNSLATYAKSPTDSQKSLASGTSSIAGYAKADTGSGSTSSSVKINNTIPSGSKDFLTKYNSMSSDDRDKAATTQNDFEYKLAQAKYDNDVAEKKLSRAQQAKAESSLAREKVGAGYSKDTRDLYGLSKSDLYGIVSNDPNGADIAQKVVDYGDALEAAGLSTNKFRTSKGAVSIRPSTGKGSESGSSRKAAKADTSRSSDISTASSLRSKVANAKVKGGGLSSFQNKVKKSGLKQYSKGTTTKVRTA